MTRSGFKRCSKNEQPTLAIENSLFVQRFPNDSVLPSFLRLSLGQQQRWFAEILGTAGHGTLKIDTDDLLRIQIAVPPLETQRAIVAEIEAEQALVEANKQLIARFEAKIKAVIDRIWGGDTA